VFFSRCSGGEAGDNPFYFQYLANSPQLQPGNLHGMYIQIQMYPIIDVNRWL